ncbi:MAG TPA: glycerol-3-phosphate 1-O-acyltransferase PlsY [Syntrophomonadaceae bacterium]|nr:glycerol-3-phosphate 1-O-acyltransferase PlsY [Syntrophomonadaceae bacterium]HPR94029.1 glycerol-3-phosphate 1-O-acyltransferase PlsY [Syntrophomonadaceae bacterium]
MQEILLVLLCYLIGSIPFSYIFSRFLGGVDIRLKGSGNVGATNVLRNLGIKVAVLALAGDIFKGFITAWIAFTFGGPVLFFLCPAAAIIGHCYPVFLKFKGGKAVATTAGIVLYIDPLIFIILLLALCLIVLISRYVSLGSLIVSFSLPFMGILFDHNLEIILLFFFAASLIIYKHKENIERLRKGTESKISSRISS